MLALTFMSFVYSDFLGSLGIYSENPSFNGADTGLFVIAILIMFISLILFYGVLYSTVLYYIKSYINSNGTVDTNEVKQGVKKDFLKIIGLSLLSNLITAFGFMLCFFPGIYAYVPMSLVFAILVFKGIGVTDSIGDSFDLVRNEWWSTFGALFVLGLIGSLIGFVFAIPGVIYGLVKQITMATEGSYSDLTSMTDWISIVLSVVGDIIRYFVIYLLTAISSAFIYFNLNERKHSTGALEQIDSLGNTDE